MIDILVVEDNDELRDVLERFLLHEGFQTRCVQRGDDALTLLQQEKVRLLLVDIMLQLSLIHILLSLFCLSKKQAEYPHLSGR